MHEFTSLYTGIMSSVRYMCACLFVCGQGVGVGVVDMKSRESVYDQTVWVKNGVSSYVPQIINRSV